MAGFDLGLARYKQQDAQNFQRRALDAIARLPGVAAAAYGSSAPLSIDQSTLLARSALPEADTAEQIRKAIGDLDSRLPLYGLGSLTQMLGFAFFPSRAATVALGAFGILAIMLAGTGIYGLAAYAVSKRTREIGIRMAVGAQPWRVLRSVLGRTAVLLSIGSCLGLALGLAAGQALSSVVYGASARDVLVLAAVALTMSVIGLVAASAPARQALSIDPIRALRQE